MFLRGTNQKHSTTLDRTIKSETSQDSMLHFLLFNFINFGEKMDRNLHTVNWQNNSYLEIKFKLVLTGKRNKKRIKEIEPK